MNKKDALLLVFYITLSFLLTSYILGIENLSFLSSKWLTAHDVTSDIVSWKFFKNDNWHFPIGANPSYGMDIGSGIAFSGSIPILAVIFKIFSKFLPDNFHYFNLWVFICFFFQSYIAFLIIYNKSKNLLFSLIGSLFFLLSPVLINRISYHLALSAHWLILIGYYLETKNDIRYKNICWAFLISLSSLVHFYFTIILFGIFLLFALNNLRERFYLKQFFKQMTQVIGSLILTMFIIGYFHVPFTDSLGYGYGDYALDVGGILSGNTSVPTGNIGWSFFFQETESLSQEGFAYLGLGGILFFVFSLIIFTLNFKKIIKKKKFIPFFLIILIFSIVAISNKIHVFGHHLTTFEIPTIFYGLLSIVRASGRLFWPVYYLIFLISIIFLYKNFSKKKSFIILIFLFTVQLIDIYPGLKKNFNAGSFPQEYKLKNYSFWNDITKNYSTIRTTYLNNESKFLLQLREVLLLKNVNKTDIATHGRYNRKQASISRSNLYKSFDQKIIPQNVIFAIANKNHLRNFIHLFKNEDVGIFLKDEVWLGVYGLKNKMSNEDINKLKIYDPVDVKFNEKINLEFYNEESIHGFGWTHNNASLKKGVWTEGNVSNLLFKLKKININNLRIKIKINSIMTKDNKPINFAIKINDKFSKKFTLKNIDELNENIIFLDTGKISFENNTVYLKFLIQNPVTNLELLKSPDARKLGLLVESIEIINN